MIVVPRLHTLLLALSTILGCCALNACAASPSAAMSRATTAPEPAALLASAVVSATVGPAQGQAIFEGQVEIEGFIACKTCHTNDPALPNSVGPNLAGVATRGAERVPNLTAPEYIARSIRIHDEFVVPGYSPGIARAVVGKDFGEILSDAQVAQLVAYLMTLDKPPALAAGGSSSGTTTAPRVTGTPSASVTSAPGATTTASPTLLSSATLTPRTSSPTVVLEPTATIPPSSATVAPEASATTAPEPSATAVPPAPAPTPAPPPPDAATPTALPTVASLPSAPSDPDLIRYAPCVSCHDLHPLQVLMPHPLNPTCNECHRGAPSQIGCPSCHSMHGVEYHEPDPNLPCATCHT